CVSRDCGRSSEWASDVFKIANLYGVDREQNYLAARLVRDGKPHYVVIYTVMRGNQRVYAQVDVLATEAAGTPNGGPSVPRPLIPWRDGDFTVSLPQALGAFVQAATEAPEKQVWVVVHTADDSVAGAMQRGQSMGERIKLWLGSRGIAAGRVQVLAVGPLAPSHDAPIPAERIELFLTMP